MLRTSSGAAAERGNDFCHSGGMACWSHLPAAPTPLSLTLQAPPPPKIGGRAHQSMDRLSRSTKLGSIFFGAIWYVDFYVLKRFVVVSRAERMRKERTPDFRFGCHRKPGRTTNCRSRLRARMPTKQNFAPFAADVFPIGSPANSVREKPSPA